MDPGERLLHDLLGRRRPVEQQMSEPLRPRVGLFVEHRELVAGHGSILARPLGVR
jgi:hypothetical protein